MINIGPILRNKRKARGLTQIALANLVGITSVQLCKIENAGSKTTIGTIKRIADAMGVSLSSLFLELEQSNESLNRRILESEGDMSISRYISMRSSDKESYSDIDILKRIVAKENRVIECERKLGIPHDTMLPFVHSIKLDVSSAQTIARFMRATCAVGSASFSDIIELLEFRNVRFHIISLPTGIQSRSFFDVENKSLSIVLSKENTNERSIYRIAYELAWAVIFGSMGFKSVRMSSLRNLFARSFAAEFLMPEESVRFAVSQLGIRMNDWTLEMVVYLKSKFNVSAESFALRLESLGLISEHLRQKTRDELHSYYKSHPKAMEPEPRVKTLKIGMRQKLLELEVERKGVEG
jgi:transcriptional regulator with XRE-family HTH domain